MADTVHTAAVVGHNYDCGGLQMDSVLKWIGTITGPTSYVQGGVDLPLPAGATLLHIQSGTVQDTYIVPGTGIKAKFMTASTGAEKAAAADLDAITVPIVVYYRK